MNKSKTIFYDMLIMGVDGDTASCAINPEKMKDSIRW